MLDVQLIINFTEWERNVIMSKKILFYGDSITDFGRDYNNIESLGCGYPLLVSAELGYEEPEAYTFINKGISGNRVVDLYARVGADVLKFKPDYMSILIGVNDVWHADVDNGISTGKYERIYEQLIKEIKDELPDIKIMIMEPFVLEEEATTSTTSEPNRWDIFDKEVRDKAVAAKRVAEKYGLKFVPLQCKFDEAIKKAPVKHWLYDGVHPAPAGHELIKIEWLKAFKEM